MNWSDVAAVAALALSVFTFARSELRNRNATILARWEARPPVGKASSGTDEFIVHNAGPGTATKVRVEFVRGDGTVMEPSIDLRSPETRVIPPGHEDSRRYIRALGEEAPSALRITWSDGRRRRQSIDAPIFRRMMPGAPHVTVKVEAPEDRRR